MKLLRSITRTYIIGSVAVLVFFTAAIFLIVNIILKKNIDEQLVNNKERMMSNYIGSPLTIFPFFEIHEISSLPLAGNDILKDTLIYNPIEKEYENFREYISYMELNKKSYLVVVRSSLIEQEDLFTAFIIIFGLSSFFLLSVLFVITKRTTSTLLAPFYKTLSQLQAFSLRSAKSVALDHTTIEEFNELNGILNDLIVRASKEYTALKEFSENASHELQTPLAIIKSKLDLLIQKENLDEEQKQAVESIYQNINKLTQLNKALLLLSQIESEGYFESMEIDFAEELQREIKTFSTIAEFKNISMIVSTIKHFPLKANPALINILIKNILSNAIKHNNEQAIVNILLKEGVFSVDNTGPKPEREPEKLFDRFQKDGLSADSVGLGLSIVKEICTLYHFDISYGYEHGFHKITVTMPASA